MFIKLIDFTKYQFCETSTYANIAYGTTLTLAGYKKTITNGTYSYGSLTESTEGGTATATTTMGINTTICLYYSRNQYTLTVNKENNYIASVTGGGTYKVGKSVTIGASVNSTTNQYTYSWAGWTGTYTSGSNPYTFTMPAQNVTLTANGARTVRKYKVTVQHYLENTDNNNFTLLTNETQYNYIEYGSTITLANYKKAITYGTYSYGSLKGSTAGGTAITSTTIYGDITIYLYYTRPKYDVTYYINNKPTTIPMKAGSTFNKKVTKNSENKILGAGTYHDGSGHYDLEYPYTVSYEFLGWSITDCKSHSSCPSYAKEYIITKDITLYPVFKAIGDPILPSASISVYYGQSYTVTEDSIYVIVEVKHTPTGNTETWSGWYTANAGETITKKSDVQNITYVIHVYSKNNVYYVSY